MKLDIDALAASTFTEIAMVVALPVKSGCGKHRNDAFVQVYSLTALQAG